MKYLRLISLITIFWIASGNLIAQSYIPDLYSSKDSTGMYTINVDILTYNFSGLLLLKKMNDTTIRLVMNSEMGPKLLDMVLLPTGYKLNYAFKKLNKKKILKTFYEDFGALSCIFTRRESIVAENYQNAPTHTFDLGKKKKIIYTTDTLLHKITSGRVEAGKTIISAFSYLYTPGTDEIISMKLEHQHFKMVISLDKFSF
jgi:hypothetical protein